MKTQTKIIIGVAAVAVIITGYFLLRKKSTTINGVKGEAVIDPSIPDGVPTTTAGNFPLKVGSKNPEVLAIQKKLGVKPETSYFGSITEAAVKKKYGVTVVDETLYNKIMA